MNLPELLQFQKIPFRRSGTYGEVWLCCPFCEERGEPSPDDKFRLGVNFIRDEGHCFRCDWATRKDAVALVLAEIAEPGSSDDITTDGSKAPVEENEPVVLPDDFQILSEVTREDGAAWTAYKYLKERGLTREIMKKKMIGVSLIGRYRYRIIFPVYWRGRLRGLVGRDFSGNAKAKYLNSRGEKYLYNMPERTDRIVLAEGAFKAIAIELAIQEPAAALLGHSVTPKMIKQLKRAKCKEVTIWPDPDTVGKEGALDVAMELQSMFKIWFIVPVPKRQADELSEGMLRMHYRKRKRFNWGVEQRIKSGIKKVVR